ncbi:hypothetical protein KF840_08570 [bacterium]|nr:hypothetical protein [bacterium]
MFFVVLALPSSLSASARCSGDCDGDGLVRIDELVRLVKAVLAVPCPFEPELCAPPDPCLGLDADGDGQVSTNELVSAITRVVEAVANGLHGCQ